ncbi:MAG: hypothetical protein NTZ39_10595 [Methanoregula sp.]|nr:hypothetical protein [Methanoregula sp.]
MDSAVENLVQLGLKEYEAKCYVALVGLGEANVRRIHEVSGVPRPRVYDVLNALDKKGFIEIRRGSPLMYYAVRPDIVVSFLKKDLDTAASESVKTLEALSVDAQQDYSPIWSCSLKAVQVELPHLIASGAMKLERSGTSLV